MSKITIAVLYPASPIGFSERFDLLDLESSQIWSTARRIVDGFIEIVHLTEPAYNPDPRAFSVGWHLVAYVNEDGIARRLPPSCRIPMSVLFGPVVFVRERVDGEGETHYESLAQADVDWIVRNARLLVPLAPTTEEEAAK